MPITDKQKLERDFHRQAVKEAVERMQSELRAASEAVHKLKDAEGAGEDDPAGYQDFDRVMELGYLVDCATGLCGPHVALLFEIGVALGQLEETAPDHAARGPKKTAGAH